MSENRYQVLGKLGQGGVGEVYLAKDTQLDRDVAIKRMKVPEGGSTEQIALDLIREAKTLSTLQHPNIVTIFDVSKDEKGPFVVLEYLKGETLGDVIDRGALPLEDFKEVVVQTLEGLIAAHALGLVHRDLKSDNLMVIWLPSGKFQIKILDFGLSKFSQKARPQTEDQGGGIMGSIFFMAPEQFERLPLDARTDMYSLGCIFYQTLTANFPFQGETGTEVMVSHLQHHVEPLQKIRPDLPEWLANWVMWLISREMDERPEDARTALEYFKNQRHGLPVVVPMVAAPARGMNPGQRPRPGGPVRPGMPAANSQMPVPNQGSVTHPIGYAPGPHSVPLQMGPGGKPKKSSKGLVIVLSTISSLVLGGVGYMVWPGKSKVEPRRNPPPTTVSTPEKTPAEKTPPTKPPAPVTPSATKTPPKATAQATTPKPPPKATPTPKPPPPRPPVAAPVLMKFNAPDLPTALDQVVFANLKSSDRVINFKAAFTHYKGSYDAKVHGPLLRQIVHETAAEFALSQKDQASHDFILAADKEKFDAKKKLACDLPLAQVETFPVNCAKFDPASKLITGWNGARSALGFDMSIEKGEWEVTLVASCPKAQGQSVEVTFGQDTSSPLAVTQTAAGSFANLNAGKFTIEKNGTHRLWIRSVVAPAGTGEILQLKAVQLKRK